MVEGVWTMDELLDRVRLALAAEYPGAPNGRVRDMPDRRAVRWYTTTGLVDRPAAMRGRHALYGPRHLLQLVAVKRRQAQGHTLAAIQAELHNAPDETLADVARIPPSVLPAGLTGVPLEDDPPRQRFWAAPAAPAAAAAPASPVADITPSPPSDRALSTGPHEVGGIALGGGAILVLPARPSARDLEDLAAAAQPLMKLLRSRGLLNDGSPS